MIEAIRSTRTKMVTIRLSPKEKAVLQEEASHLGVKLSDYIRIAINEKMSK